jgi:TPR repeat protein
MPFPKARPLALLVAVFALIGCGPRTEAQPTDTAAPAGADDPKTSGSPVQVKPAPEAPRGYDNVTVLTVGIGKYKSARVQEIEYGERDSEAFGDLLRTEYGYAHQALDGPKATKAAVLDRLRQVAAAAKANDAVIFYFAGHGRVVNLESYGRTGFLVPYDADVEIERLPDLKEWKEQAIEMTELTAILEKSEARHAVIVLDACASGFLTRRGDGAVLRADQQELLTRRSRSVLAASAENESAFSNHTARLGNFTAALVGRLRTKAPTALTDLFADARAAVAKDSKRASLPQMGHFGTDDGEFVFIPLAVSKNEVREALAEVRTKIVARNGRRTELSHLYEALDAGEYRGASDLVDEENVWRQKVTRFEDNAAAGDPVAMAALSVARRKGLGGEADPKLAFLWARRAFETKHPAGRAVLAHCLFAGTGVKKNVLAAERLLSDTPNPKPPYTAFVAAEILRETTSEAAAKVEALYAEAERGGIESGLTRSIEMGLERPGVTKEQIGGYIKRLKPLADKGRPVANRLIYRAITAMPKPLTEADRKTAETCLTRAATAGDGPSQAALAREYFQEEWITGELGLKADRAMAFRWAELAMENEALESEPRTDAKQIVAICLVTGKGTKQDVPRGLKLANQTTGGDSKNGVKMTVWLLTVAVDYIKP